jgi:K+-transporting ATPase ATPase B chain
MAGRQVRKGAADSIKKHVEIPRWQIPARCTAKVDEVARRGSTPLVVADGTGVLGVIELKDIVKGGIKERFAELRKMGIATIMVTGDNRVTAAAIAAEAGVDDFLLRSDAGSQARPDPRVPVGRPAGGDDRRRHQRRPGAGPGRRRGGHEHRHASRQGSRQHGRPGFQPDQADRGRRNRQADADDARLADHIQHRQRHVAKYFAIIPAAFVTTYPQLAALNVMGLASPASAILSAVIFNALIIVFLIPLALKGVKYRAARRGDPAAPEPGDLRPGRRHRSLYRHQADRPGDCRHRSGLRRKS